MTRDEEQEHYDDCYYAIDEISNHENAASKIASAQISKMAKVLIQTYEFLGDFHMGNGEAYFDSTSKTGVIKLSDCPGRIADVISNMISEYDERYNITWNNVHIKKEDCK